eukprot:2001899-Ditylum_brightwellii.AAC.1
MLVAGTTTKRSFVEIPATPVRLHAVQQRTLRSQSCHNLSKAPRLDAKAVCLKRLEHAGFKPTS